MSTAGTATPSAVSSNQTVIDETQSAANGLKRFKESPLSDQTPYLLPSYDDFHARMAAGRGLHLDMWRYLFDTLILPQFPGTMFLRGGNQSYELEPGQKAYRLKSQRTGKEGLKSCWCIQEFEGGSFTVKEYRLRDTYGNTSNQPEEILKGVPTWKMQAIVHQETPLNQPDRVPFEDAIVFDMLLDLVTGNFEPHTKDIDEAPQLQLEILRLLEKAHQDAVEDASMAPGMPYATAEGSLDITDVQISEKRRLSMQDRLNGKRRKRS